jgi:hypothetical protein
MAHRSASLSRALKASSFGIALVASSGCLVFTSIADLGGQTRPTADGGDAPEEGADSGGLTDRLVEGGAGTFGPSTVIARTAPGLRGVAVDSSRVYFTNDETGEVRYTPKTGDGDAGSTLLSVATRASDIAVDATRVYWIQYEKDTGGNLGGSFVFRSIRKDGTDLANGGGNYFTSLRMTMAGGHVYTSTFTAGSQWWIMRDGLGVVQPVNTPAMKCVVSDGATVFYELGGVLRTYPEPDGGGIPFATVDATDLAVDETDLYWITASGSVQKLGKDKRGDKPIDLATGVSAATRIAIDDQSVYVTAWGIGTAKGRVVRIPKAGGPPVDLVTGLQEPWGIAVDAAGVYVANHGDGTVLALPRL